MGQFLGPETDRMCQFLGPETDIMGERYFMISSTSIIEYWSNESEMIHAVYSLVQLGPNPFWSEHYASWAELGVHL